jgi:hypothetical protein
VLRCGRDGVASVIVACGTKSSAPVSCDRASTMVISHTAKRHGLYGVRNISKRPLNVSSGPGTGSRSRGQLSRLSIGWIGSQTPSGDAQAERQMGGCRCSNRMCMVLLSLSNETQQHHSAHHTAIAYFHRVTRRRRFAAALPRLLSWSCGLGEGGWAIIDTHHDGRQPTTVVPLLISFVQAMQPRPGPAVGEQI